MNGDGKFEWYYAISEDSEAFYSANSFDDAILGGRREFGGNHFFICEADKSVANADIDYMLLAESTLETLSEQNAACWGEDSAGWDGGDVEGLRSRLEAAVRGWVKDNPAETYVLANFRNCYWVRGADGSLPDKVPPNQVAPGQVLS